MSIYYHKKCIKVLNGRINLNPPEIILFDRCKANSIELTFETRNRQFSTLAGLAG